jgi:hypothetical protein
LRIVEEPTRTVLAIVAVSVAVLALVLAVGGQPRLARVRRVAYATKGEPRAHDRRKDVS